MTATHSPNRPGRAPRRKVGERMQVTRQHVVDILRTARLPELAEEARRVLPDPVEYNDAARFLFQNGITKDDLISRVGGSP
jgi:hypothetical protein